MDIHVGDTLVMKKTHPCGSNRWEVLRIGADFKLRCTGCGRCAGIMPGGDVPAALREAEAWLSEHSFF